MVDFYLQPELDKITVYMVLNLIAIKNTINIHGGFFFDSFKP